MVLLFVLVGTVTVTTIIVTSYYGAKILDKVPTNAGTAWGSVRMD